MPNLAAAILPLVCLAQAPAAPPPTRLLVLPLTATSGVPHREVTVLSDFMAAESRRIPKHHVVSQQDIEQMLSLEARQQLAGCDTTGCLAEVAGALDADEVLYGSVGRLGADELVLTLSRVDPRKGRALPGGAERITGSGVDAALDAVPRLLARLYKGYVPPPPRVGPPRLSAVAPALFLVGAAVQYAAFSSIFTSLIFAPIPLVGLCCMGTSGAACLTAPFLGSWLQAWVLDRVGRRQAGTRKAVLAGVAALAAVGVFTTCSGLLLIPSAWLIGMRIPADVRAERDNVNRALYLIFPLRAEPQVDLALAALTMTIWTGLCAMLLVVPSAQTLALVFGSRLRSADSDTSQPALWGPHEDPPRWLRWLPHWLVGGHHAPALDEDIEANAPAAPPPVMAPPPPAATGNPPAAATPPAPGPAQTEAPASAPAP